MSRLWSPQHSTVWVSILCRKLTILKTTEQDVWGMSWRLLGRVMWLFRRQACTFFIFVMFVIFIITITIWGMNKTHSLCNMTYSISLKHKNTQTTETTHKSDTVPGPSPHAWVSQFRELDSSVFCVIYSLYNKFLTNILYVFFFFDSLWWKT